MVRLGEIFADRYRIERVLGEGGMGIVVAAHHIHLDERVALKFLKAEISSDPECAARFLREARTATKVKGEHIARVFDAGTHEGTHYMVMEYLEGETLGSIAERTGPMPALLVSEHVLQMCDALGQAHASGIVHRDLKPDNVFITTRSNGTSCVKLLDFGISKIMGDSAARLTATSAFMGSPLYMSPEQLVDPRGVDHRTDIWALGVMLFELVSGKPPFDGESMPQLCVRIREMPAPVLRSVCPSAPEALERVIARCLQKDRADRFQSADELAASLQGILKDSAARTLSAPAGPELVALPVSARPRRKVLAASVAASVLLALVGVGLAAAARLLPMKSAPSGEVPASQLVASAASVAIAPETIPSAPPTGVPAVLAAVSPGASASHAKTVTSPPKTTTNAGTHSPAAKPSAKPSLPTTPDDR
jgi:eukaryotic-like serine/threonine-protein kinase